MKTITLTDEAYERLKSWKTESSESFSKVVLKVIPKKGTAADMEDAFECLKPLTAAEAGEVLSTFAWANDWKRAADTWASDEKGDEHAS